MLLSVNVKAQSIICVTGLFKGMYVNGVCVCVFGGGISNYPKESQRIVRHLQSDASGELNSSHTLLSITYRRLHTDIHTHVNNTEFLELICIKHSTPAEKNKTKKNQVSLEKMCQTNRKIL